MQNPKDGSGNGSGPTGSDCWHPRAVFVYHEKNPARLRMLPVSLMWVLRFINHSFYIDTSLLIDLLVVVKYLMIKYSHKIIINGL